MTDWIVLWESEGLRCVLNEYPSGQFGLYVLRGGTVRASEFYDHGCMPDLLSHVLQRAETLKLTHTERTTKDSGGSGER